MNQVLEIIQGKKSPGIYELSLNLSPVELSQLCQDNHCQLFYIEGDTIFEKPDFFRVSIPAINLPEYFGKNWDAWEECITDLSWCESSSYLFVYKNPQNFATHSPEDWEIFKDILSTTIAYWSEQKISFSVIFTSELIQN